MGLLCALGRHRPEPWPQWNAGYYFTVCGRCGRDLVRTAYDSWHIPKGRRVVWSTTAPENAVGASFAFDAEARPLPANAGMKLAIEEVLRTLGAGIPPQTENADEARENAANAVSFAPAEKAPANEEPTGPVTRPEVGNTAPVPSSHVPDFMDDDSNDGSWDEPWDGEFSYPGTEAEVQVERPESGAIRSRT